LEKVKLLNPEAVKTSKEKRRFYGFMIKYEILEDIIYNRILKERKR